MGLGIDFGLRVTPRLGVARTSLGSGVGRGGHGREGEGGERRAALP